jgi:predicted DNA-binding transcriptional regulator YafY
MRKAERLFQLTNLIRAKQPITAEQIAEELDVSVRTVYRYIDDLSVSGIPIYGTTGIGYKLHEHFELPPLNLTEGKLDALVLGVKMVTSWTGDTLSESARSLASKIESVLPSQLRKEYARTIYAPWFSERKKDRNVWEIVYNAIKSTNSISIAYRALNGRKTSRTIYPLGLFYWGGKWTIGSWCTLRKEFRDFRLDRIEGVTLREKYKKKSYKSRVIFSLS